MAEPKAAEAKFGSWGAETAILGALDPSSKVLQGSVFEQFRPLPTLASQPQPQARNFTSGLFRKTRVLLKAHGKLREEVKNNEGLNAQKVEVYTVRS